VPQSMSRILVHVVFSTKDRKEFLKTEEARDDMSSYIAGILRDMDCAAILVNATEDHVHILCALSRNVSVAALVEEVKTASSKWAKSNALLTRFAWQSGYAAFSVSPSEVLEVKHYIVNQTVRHGRQSFQDELRKILRAHGVDYDERYVWG